MASPTPFPHAAFLSRLELSGAPACVAAYPTMPAALARVLMAVEETGQPAPASAQLVRLLHALAAVRQASFDTAVVADELRRYQKFARPGRPSAQIVQLRQQQAAARQAGSQSRQAFVGAAAAFVREAGIEVPPRVALELFVSGWIDANVPKDDVPATA